MAKAERTEQRSDPLQTAWHALDTGDVVAARRLAAAVLAAAPSSTAEAEAREILRKTGIAWPVLLYGAAAAVLILILVAYAVYRTAHP
jgi:hypothetical protein